MKTNLNRESKSREEDYREILRLSQKLGLPVIQAFVGLEVKKGDQVLWRVRERSRTWNRNFWNSTLCRLGGLDWVSTNFGAGYCSGKQTGASVLGDTASSIRISYIGGAGSLSAGIVVGVGTAAESFEGYVLATPVLHGVTAGKLSYLASEAITGAYVAGTKTWTVTHKRYMDNSSGGEIDISEVALYGLYPTYSYIFMFSRDLLGAAVSVPNSSRLTAWYELTLTFPA